MLRDCKITFIVAPSGECLVVAVVSTLHLFDSVTLTFIYHFYLKMKWVTRTLVYYPPETFIDDNSSFFVLECWLTHTCTEPLNALYSPSTASRDGSKICQRGRTMTSSEREPITEVWGRTLSCVQGQRGSVSEAPEAESFLSIFIQKRG